MSVKFIDLFAGIGGFHTAICKVLPDAQCVFACDIDEHARTTYQNNYNMLPHGDIKEVDVLSLPTFDMLCGGFPCQSFSVAQWKETKGFDDPRGTLFFELLKIVDAHKPKVVLLENVANLVRIDKGKAISKICDELVNRGYYVSYEVLNAKDFGVPQNRERVYIVGSLLKQFDMSMLITKRSDIKLKDILDDNLPDNVWVSSDTYTLIEEQHIKTQPKSGLKFIGYMNGNLRKKGVVDNTEHLSRVHKQINRIYSTDGVHPTISASETSGRYYIYDSEQKKVRKLTINECYKLMAFPSSFQKHRNNSKAYHQIGNSVCVKVVETVIEEIIRQELL